jgi:ABC-type microcin C transport system permease subunit YejE
VLLGYSIPSFVLGVVLLVYFAGGTYVQWFPLRGIVSTNWADLSLWGKVTDYLWHITLPVTAMVVGGFAVITILTKNSVLEEVRKQYVLTARAKGVDERVVLWKHVFRNALIPIMTGFPAAFVGAFFGGSLLIETLFSLDGLGLAVLRIGHPARLSGGLRQPVRVHPDRPAYAPDPRPDLRVGRPAREVLRLMALRQESPGRRAWRRFRSNRLGYRSLMVLVVLFALSLVAEILSNDRPIVARYQGQWYAPVFQTLPETTVRRRLRDADRLSRPGDPRQPLQGRATSRSTRPTAITTTRSTTSPRPRIRRRPARKTGSAPTTAGATCSARLLYGFRLSLVFALIVTVICTAFGILYGAVQGYFAGWSDIGMERFKEVWGAMPQLYMLIIFASLFSASVSLLIILISVFGWLGIAAYIRAEFLKNRTLDYVRAARALGAEQPQDHVAPHPAQQPDAGDHAGAVRNGLRPSARSPASTSSAWGAARHPEPRRAAQPGKEQPRMPGGFRSPPSACWW